MNDVANDIEKFTEQISSYNDKKIISKMINDAQLTTLETMLRKRNHCIKKLKDSENDIKNLLPSIISFTIKDFEKFSKIVTNYKGDRSGDNIPYFSFYYNDMFLGEYSYYILDTHEYGVRMVIEHLSYEFSEKLSIKNNSGVFEKIEDKIFTYELAKYFLKINDDLTDNYFIL
jgi:hypothetical protein